MYLLVLLGQVFSHSSMLPTDLV